MPGIQRVGTENLRPHLDEPIDNGTGRVRRISASRDVCEFRAKPLDVLLRQIPVTAVMRNLHPLEAFPITRDEVKRIGAGISREEESVPRVIHPKDHAGFVEWLRDGYVLHTGVL
jgi:hypothetical protein